MCDDMNQSANRVKGKFVKTSHFGQIKDSEYNETDNPTNLKLHNKCSISFNQTIDKLLEYERKIACGFKT